MAENLNDAHTSKLRIHAERYRSIFAHKGREETIQSVQITVELKNDLAISGELHSVDQYLNVKLNNVRVLNENKYPHMVSLALTPSLLQASEIVLLLAKTVVPITANS